MKKSILFAFISFFIQFNSFGSYFFEVNMLGNSMTVTGKFAKSTDEYFSLEKVRIINSNGEKSYIATDGGWGSDPLNALCDEVTNGNYPYAQSYGVVDTPSIFGPSKNNGFLGR